MAQRVEEVKKVTREVMSDEEAAEKPAIVDDQTYEEEYYDVSNSLPEEESGLNTASGVLALVLLALAVYLIWAALR